MSLSSEQFDDGRRPYGSRPLPIACRVCNRVFLDNVSLVLHFESHLKDRIRLSGKNPASMRGGGQHSSASWSPYSRSPLPRMNDARRVVFSRRGDYFRPCPLVNRTPRDPNHLYIPVANVSRPIHHPIMGQYGATSSSPRPLMFSQSGARNFGYGLAAPPHLWSRVTRRQNGGQIQFPDNIPPIRQRANPIPPPEIIILSDDEDGDNTKTEIDLALKL